MRRPRAVEQRQHGGVAGGDPGLFGQAGLPPTRHAWHRWPSAAWAAISAGAARASAAAPAALTRPRRSRKRSSERMPARPRPSVRAPAPSLRRAARKPRRSAGRRSAMSGDAGRAAAMAGEEMQELARVALIGLDGQRRQPALARQHLQPAFARRLEVGLGRDEEFLHGGFPQFDQRHAERRQVSKR